MPYHYRPDDLARIETKARTLARSGKYRSHVEIRNVLEAGGYDLTARIFDNRWSQAEIDRLCDRARGLARSVVKI
jgi:hypothetical protein